MKKSLIMGVLLIGGALMVSLQNSSSKSNEEHKPQSSKLKWWLKVECTKTYPSGTVTGNRCVTGGPLLQCTEVNPNCTEQIGG